MLGMSSLLYAIISIHEIIKLSERSRGASDFIFQSKKIKTFVDCDIKNKKNKKNKEDNTVEIVDEKKINYDLFQDVVRVYVHLLCVVGVRATQSLGDLHLVDKAEQSRKKDTGIYLTFHYFCFQ